MSVTVRAFQYTDSSVPDGYTCGACGASGIRLFRKYQTVLSHQSLLCRPCSKIEQGKGAEFERECEEWPGAMQWQVGWRVAAIPTEEGDTYWGYTSTPQEGADWWLRLPPDPTAAARGQEDEQR